MEPLLQETLQSRDFSGEDLLKIQAEHCRFVSCIFEDALLEHCRFSGCVFRFCEFSGTMLRQCELLSCTFEHCRFFASDLVDCKMLGSVFRDCTVTALHISCGRWISAIMICRACGWMERISPAVISRTAILPAAACGKRFWQRRICGVPISGERISGGWTCVLHASIKPGLISQKQCVWQNSPAIW